MNKSRTITLLVGAAALVIIIAGLKSTSHIVGPLMLALALTIVFHPLRLRLERRLPVWAASIVVLIAAYLLILGLTLALLVAVGRLAVLIPSYASESTDFAAGISDWLSSLGVGAAQAEAMVEGFDIGKIVDVATSVLSSSLSVLSNLFFIVTLLLFLAFDAAHVSRLAEGAREHHQNLVDALGSFARGTRTYLGVSAIFGLIVAVIDTGLLWALGVPGAFVWGVLAFVTNFIPNIGFVIGIVPPALIGLLEGGPGLMLAVIILYSLVNVVIQSVIQPRYVGSAVGLSTTLTFMSLVFWTWVLGPLGALLAVPMSLFFKAILVQADPDARWLDPLISGDPEDTPVVQAP